MIHDALRPGIPESRSRLERHFQRPFDQPGGEPMCIPVRVFALRATELSEIADKEKADM